MVFAHQSSVGALDVGVARARRQAERGVCIVESRLRRRCPGTRCAGHADPQQRLQLGDVALGQAQTLRDANEHCVLGWMHLAVCDDGHALQLQE